MLWSSHSISVFIISRADTRTTYESLRKCIITLSLRAMSVLTSKSFSIPHVELQSTLKRDWTVIRRAAECCTTNALQFLTLCYFLAFVTYFSARTFSHNPIRGVEGERGPRRSAAPDRQWIYYYLYRTSHHANGAAVEEDVRRSRASSKNRGDALLNDFFSIFRSHGGTVTLLFTAVPIVTRRSSRASRENSYDGRAKPPRNREIRRCVIP